MTDLSRTKTSIIIFILIINFFLFSGCSVILSENKFIPNVDESKWRKVRIDPYDYTLNTVLSRSVLQYSNNNFAITIPSYYNKDKCPISEGPLLLPVIPTFFSCFFLEKKKEFNFTFKIRNTGNPLSIDIQGTQLIKPGGQVVTPKNARLRKLGRIVVSEAGVLSVYPYSNAEKFESISSPVIIEKGEIILFSLDYSQIDRNEELKIEFGKIFSDEKSLALPPLILRSGNIIVFCPVILIGHEPCFIND